jgi:hypothetical protein
MKANIMGVTYTIIRKQPLRNDPSYWVIHAVCMDGRTTVHNDTNAFLEWAENEGMAQRSERRPMGVMKAALLSAGLQ